MFFRNVVWLLRFVLSFVCLFYSRLVEWKCVKSCGERCILLRFVFGLCLCGMVMIVLLSVLGF